MGSAIFSLSPCGSISLLELSLRRYYLRYMYLYGSSTYHIFKTNIYANNIVLFCIMLFCFVLFALRFTRCVLQYCAVRFCVVTLNKQKCNTALILSSVNQVFINWALSKRLGCMHFQFMIFRLKSPSPFNCYNFSLACVALKRKREGGKGERREKRKRVFLFSSPLPPRLLRLLRRLIFPARVKFVTQRLQRAYFGCHVFASIPDIVL